MHTRKTNRRITNEKQLLDAIADCQSQHDCLIAQADHNESSAKTIFANRATNRGDANSYAMAMNEVDRLRKRANSLLNVRRPNLIRELAKFQTQPFAFMPDNTIKAPPGVKGTVME